jgi:hypothetical protein
MLLLLLLLLLLCRAQLRQKVYPSFQQPCRKSKNVCCNVSELSSKT